MNNSFTIKNYEVRDKLNQKIVEMIRDEIELPDVNLVTANNGNISAHRLILSMYSKYVRRVLRPPDVCRKIHGN